MKPKLGIEIETEFLDQETAFCSIKIYSYNVKCSKKSVRTKYWETQGFQQLYQDFFPAKRGG